MQVEWREIKEPQNKVSSFWETEVFYYDHKTHIITITQNNNRNEFLSQDLSSAFNNNTIISV